MTTPAARSAGSAWLRLRVVLARTSAVTAVGAALLLAVCSAAAWLLLASTRLAAEEEAWQAAARRASMAAAAPTPAPAPVLPQEPADRLQGFYAALGPRRYAEQQVKTLFALAARNGLTLSQGEYKSGYDRNARVATYQVNLPVKGSYGAIWQFAFDVLRAIPFASLDDIGFRRDGIQDPVVEARLRLTFYLSDANAGAGAGAGEAR